MTLSIGQKLNGFTVKNVRRLEELGAYLYELVHDKTGAQLCWYNDGDENKLFSVAFKTIPEDSTGVFHILEHTVLNGSDSFPVKEPFVELLKASLNTFLNAMTFSDKTMYPVSSRNTRDYLNLTKVYLDAVFNPLIGKNPNIFRQEGWHIELTDKEAEPVYKGVVFNEMKGAMSSIDDVVESGVSEMLFPDSPYRHNSGGAPEVIPSLTYEKYIDTYNRFYHPSNARFWLDGDLPIEETLRMINDDYLSKYERREENHDIPVQKLLPAQHHTVYSELSEGETPENKAQLVFGRIAANWNETERIYAIEVLTDYLCGSNDAPLTRAILEKNLGQDVTMNIEDGIMQPVFTLRIHNTENDREAAVRDTLRTTVKDIVEAGMDRAELEAIINKMEFSVKQPHEPAGLIRGIMALSTWLYGGDPADGLLRDAVFAGLREKLKTDYFEELLKEITDEKSLCLLHVLPSLTLGEERRADEQKRLAAIRAGWTEEELLNAVKATEELMAWQQTPDSPEALATIPRLPLSEINPEPECVPVEVSEVDGATLLTHRMNCKGVVHVTMHFCLNGCDYQAATLLPELLGSLPTGKHDVRTLVREMKAVIGEYHFGLFTSAKPNQNETCGVWLEARFSALESKLQAAEELIIEVLTDTRFEDFAKIKEIVLQSDEQLRQSMVSSGHALAGMRAASCYSAYAAMNETLNGLARIHYMHELAAGFDDRITALAQVLCETLKSAVCRARLVLGVASDAETDMTAFIDSFEMGEQVEKDIPFSLEKPLREGIVIPAQIGYAAMATSNKGVRHGSSDALRVIANYSYLWNEVRVKGGAYGCGMSPIAPGVTGFYSFRDPSAGKTLGVYRSMGAWLNEFVAAAPSVSDSIISAVGSMDRLSTVKDKAIGADHRYLNSYTDEERRIRRKELIETTAKDLYKWLPVFEDMQNASVCVVANKAALDECTDEGLVITEI